MRLLEQQITEKGGRLCRCGDPESVHIERPMDWYAGVEVQDACSECPCWTFTARPDATTTCPFCELPVDGSPIKDAYGFVWHAECYKEEASVGAAPPQPYAPDRLREPSPVVADGFPDRMPTGHDGSLDG